MSTTADEGRQPDPALLEAMYKRVAAQQYMGTSPSDSPTAVLLGGQPGAGKSELRRQAVADFNGYGGAVVVDADIMREAVPGYAALRRVDPGNAADRTHVQAGQFAQRLANEAIQDRRNLIIDGTLRDPDRAEQLARRLNAAGYKVEVRAMAVSSEVSLARARLRYEMSVAAQGSGRFVNTAQHDQAYAGLPQSLTRLEDNKLVQRVGLYNAAAERIYDNSLSKDGWVRTAQVADSLERERKRPMTHHERSEFLGVLFDIDAAATARGAKDPAISAQLNSVRSEIDARERSVGFQRAQAFTNLKQPQALARYPELDGAYASLRETVAKAGGSDAQRLAVYTKARDGLAEQLQAGGIPTGPVSMGESERVIKLAAQHQNLANPAKLESVTHVVRGEVVAQSSHHILLRGDDQQALYFEKELLDKKAQVGSKIMINPESGLTKPEERRHIIQEHSRGRELDRDQGR